MCKNSVKLWKYEDTIFLISSIFSPLRGGGGVCRHSAGAEWLWLSQQCQTRAVSHISEFLNQWKRVVLISVFLPYWTRMIKARDAFKKNYETYYRSARVQVLTISKYLLTKSNNFLGLYRSILVYLGLFWTILVYTLVHLSASPVYLGLSRYVSVYLGLSRSI